jgi:hypothetical protein
MPDPTPYKDGLYLRMNPADKGSLPRQGTTTTSPDLICNVDRPLDPNDLKNYDKMFPAEAIPGRFNYVYARAKNLSNKIMGGRIFVYSTGGALVLWPSNWKPILSVNNHTPYLPLDPVAENQVAVTSEPGGWTPDPKGPDHYCLVGRLETEGHPNPLPSDTVVDLARLMQMNPGYAWRNVQLVSAPAADRVRRVAFQQKDETTTFLFFGFCRGVPTGVDISLSAAGSGMDPVDIRRQTVDRDQFYTSTANSRIVQNFQGIATFQIFLNGRTLPPTAEFGVVIGSFRPREDPAVDAGIFRPLERWGLERPPGWRLLANTFGASLEFAPIGNVTVQVE